MKKEMTIHFIIGPPGSGKTTFRKKRFPTLPHADVWDYQADCDSLRGVWKSYVYHRRECIRMAGLGCDFVIEHTLMKAKRRVYYINKLAQHDLVCWYTTWDGYYVNAMASFELPQVEEGFAEVWPISEREEQHAKR